MDLMDGRVMLIFCFCFSVLLCLLTGVVYKRMGKKWLNALPSGLTLAGLLIGIILTRCKNVDQMVVLGLIVYSFWSFVFTGAIMILVISYRLRNETK